MQNKGLNYQLYCSCLFLWDGHYLHQLRWMNIMLQELGITKVGHLKRIQQGIKDIQERIMAQEKSSTTL